MSPAETAARALGGARKSSSGWSCRCPAHDDHNPSLTITDAGDGRILVHCHAGCTQNSVIAELKARSLWPGGTDDAVTAQQARSGPSEVGWTPVFPVPEGAREPRIEHPTLGKPSQKWEYPDEENRLLGYMLRFDTPRSDKTFRPLTYWRNREDKCEWRYQGFPKPFPLYGLHRLAARHEAPVIIAEGEKAAEYAGKLCPDMVAVSWPHGAKSVSDVNWSPIAGRQVYVWPDSDEVGLQAGKEVCRRCLDAGAKSVRLIKPPSGVAEGWDAADAYAEDRPPEQISKLFDTAEKVASDFESISADVVDLSKWRGDRYSGAPPERCWLIKDVLPLGVPTMLAAMGGIGKSMTALQLALEVALGDLVREELGEPPLILGGLVACHGNVVLITAEDDEAELHRRVALLDPHGYRLLRPERLTLVPLPNAGGFLTLLRRGFEGPEITDAFRDLYRQLMAINGLRLVILDPLQAFVGADANKDPAVGQFLCTVLGKLATATGATVLLTHHFRKQGLIKGPADAREAVRGTTALIDGMRCAYALWSLDETRAKKVCREIGTHFEPNKVVNGSVVKANCPIDWKVTTFVRNDFGLLCDRTAELASFVRDRGAILDQLRDAIENAASVGKPYTKTGKSGVYEHREELPLPLRKMGRNRLQELVQELLNADRARQCAAQKSRIVQWLDVPGGPFDQGEGTFAPGALKATG